MQVLPLHYYTLTAVIFITFILSIILICTNRVTGYLRFFPLYHGTSVLTELITEIFFSTSGKNSLTSYIPYNLFTLFEFLFFSLYIYNTVTTGKALIITSITGFLFMYFTAMKNSSFECPNDLTLLIQNLFLLIQCIVYFNDVFTTFSSSNLAKEPAFWIVTGIMFYSIIMSPGQIYRFFSGRDSYLLAKLYVTANSTGYIFMYCLFIKAYTCKAAR
jgi:hypothetical protein